ncbi:inovirus-type Gp2 protein [Pseudomonas sp. YQ_6]|uniref:YagK/YfjJ domain-containing protein n=2 Tax=Pseudomonas TaxID=286 RepID=UPI000F7A533A|nr:inovirus-type Gp2 protein [Pseudomonas fulva]MDH0571554.1 inovirus Gp2 family protein [Pseudomonas fulva]RRW63724.1 inovirus Gp2 family protein [Pseudomonas fulva]
MTITSAGLFRGLPIRASVKRNKKSYVEILARIHDQLFSLMTHHSRITVIRVDLRFPDGPRLGHKKEGQLLSAYIEAVKIRLGSLSVCRVGKVIHGAAREIGPKKGKPHCHVFFGFNSRKRDLGEINGAGHTGLWQFIDQTWIKLAGGTTHIVPKVHRFDWFDVDKLGECFKHLSYLAKVESKNYGTGESYKRFTASRLKRKADMVASCSCRNLRGDSSRCRDCFFQANHRSLATAGVELDIIKDSVDGLEELDALCSGLGSEAQEFDEFIKSIEMDETNPIEELDALCSGLESEAQEFDEFIKSIEVDEINPIEELDALCSGPGQGILSVEVYPRH